MERKSRLALATKMLAIGFGAAIIVVFVIVLIRFYKEQKAAQKR
jgi:hypothetical protein